MLTRLRVSGFKNLVDVDLRLGPFTCVAGSNGVGKSNLFDAVHFLSLLADHSLVEAAREVRGGAARSLFHRVGDTTSDVMAFEAEMIVPAAARDDLGQEAKATITFLRYSLELARRGTEGPGPPSFEILKEELHHIPRGLAHQHLPFRHSAGKWRATAIVGERRVPFLSTSNDGGERTILLHQDGGARHLRYQASRLPRTVLSGCNSAETPTALLVRREMQSWRRLQLEPSALRRPDELISPSHLASDGSHLAATLYRLTQADAGGDDDVCARLARRLAELMDDVRSLRVDRDERRETLSLEIVDREGTRHRAPSLSDGSLRFLALALLEADPQNQGLVCVEEPENGVHPERIPALLKLLQDMAVDVRAEVSLENPLRQVIVNTHSPAVVAQVPDDSLLLALSKETKDAAGRPFRKVELHPLPGTWRAEEEGSLVPVPFDQMLAYLNPLRPPSVAWRASSAPRRVVDRDDVQPLLPFGEVAE